MQLCITSVSSKGQVVIPGNIRTKLGIAAGARMMVMTDGENVLMKPIAAPQAEEREESCPSENRGRSCLPIKRLLFRMWPALKRPKKSLK